MYQMCPCGPVNEVLNLSKGLYVSGGPLSLVDPHSEHENETFLVRVWEVTWLSLYTCVTPGLSVKNLVTIFSADV